jgi:hypothetical protein
MGHDLGFGDGFLVIFYLLLGLKLKTGKPDYIGKEF